MGRPSQAPRATHWPHPPKGGGAGAARELPRVSWATRNRGVGGVKPPVGKSICWKGGFARQKDSPLVGGGGRGGGGGVGAP